MDSPALPPDSEFRFAIDLRTRWCDEDAQRVLNNAVYLTLFEEARLRYFGDLGLVEGDVFPFVLAQTNVRFVAPGRGGRTVTVRTRTTHLGRSSIQQVYRVQGTDPGGTWAEAEALLVGWDTSQRCKAAWSEAFRRRVSEFEGLPLG